MMHSGISLQVTIRQPKSVIYDELRLERCHIHQGHLILVNRDNPVRASGWKMEQALLQEAPNVWANVPDISLEKTCLQQLSALLQVTKAEEGIIVVSGYRSEEEQRQIYQTSLEKNGATFTASFVARPSESEHHTGLAVDVGENTAEVDFICPSFPDYGAAEQFKMLAADFGFIQRYTEDKASITGIACEPWHYRYVGFPHSILMNQLRYCLEEYSEFLKQYPHNQEHLYLETINTLMEIYYVPANRDVTVVPIAKGEHHQLSGNNQDGFVVTVFHVKGRE